MSLPHEQEASRIVEQMIEDMQITWDGYASMAHASFVFMASACGASYVAHSLGYVPSLLPLLFLILAIGSGLLWMLASWMCRLAHFLRGQRPFEVQG